MREIIADTNYPMCNIAKWLICEILKMFNAYSVVESLKECRVEDDEILVSYDVKGLNPSIPVKEALRKLKEMIEQHDAKAKAYTKLAASCMSEHYFQE
ncbi:unnamed protein product [Hermetia illucens]|uniref:Uncharacterized protein n=1 Tax=Hermetia illucens TaxID=343691 RepID=A0A7R8YNG9_HERIL|nr:unnamed protein product [Hermetia illucens]